MSCQTMDIEWCVAVNMQGLWLLGEGIIAWPSDWFHGKNRLKNGKTRCIWEKFLRFATVNSHCRHRNMAAVNMKKNPFANLWLIYGQKRTTSIYEPTFFNLTSQRYFGQVRNLAGLKHILKGILLELANDTFDLVQNLLISAVKQLKCEDKSALWCGVVFYIN